MDLLISDLHLTENPLEEYRWKVFEWVYDLTEKHDIDKIYILGDLTEKKDHHSSKLVNRLVEDLILISKQVNEIYILRGNHDCIDPEWPFFLFLNSHKNIYYHDEPVFVGNDLFLPHSKDLKADLNSFDIPPKELYKGIHRIFLHQTIKGGKAGNGMDLEGFSPDIFAGYNGLIFSGDLHKPQEVRPVVYVGSPYPVYFGDDFIGGAILLDGDKWERIQYKTIRRVMLDVDFATQPVKQHFTVHKGDQFKVRILVNRSDSDKFDGYKKLVRQEIENRQGIVVSMELKIAQEKQNTMAKKRKFKNLDPETIFNRHCKTENLDEFYQRKGKEFL